MPMNRRDMVSMSLAAMAAPQTVWGESDPLGAVMRMRAETLLASLDAQQRDAVLFPFKGRARRAWNFMTGSNPAPGLRLEKIAQPQKDLALDLLATALSPVGLQKAEHIMLQQDILRDEWGKGSADRNRERFSLQIYGTPSATDAWTWRWEGHHLSLSFTIVQDQVVSMTPSSFSSEPNLVPSGPHAGLLVLKEEERLGRDLFGDLTGAARRAALISDGAPGNIRSNRGRDAAIAQEGAGVPLADLSRSQADIVRRLVEVYTSEPVTGALAQVQRARLDREDWEAMRFAWAGTDPDSAVYYRITGNDVLIEFATLFNQPQHLHAVFHDVSRNFGAHVLS